MPHNHLISSVEKLQADFGLTPVIASEIEFYFHGSEPDEGFWAGLMHACIQHDIPILKHDKERGKAQYEVAFQPSNTLICADKTRLFTDIATHFSSQNALKIDFSAKPFADEPGSGLHIHIHLENSDGKNVYFKNDEVISDELKFSIGGLLDQLPASMPIFAPHESSYARFTEKSNAPLTVSWGANNRTVAIRLPDSTHDNKRIEHRVAGADADPEAVITAILTGIHHGLSNKICPPPQIYGDASLEMYGLPRLTG